ncbi:hypothetical protein [Dactylosporangium sp. NPDC051541]|uniref:hypothetical protein n=1 Tax=Dactylosporangium sp. NPDC051541 TaxID=3363977 RepID=UPI00379DE078
MAIGGWRLLSSSASNARAVVAVDFTLAKVRAQANFGDLATHLPAAVTLWASDETGWPAEPGDPRAHLAAWRSRAAALGNFHAALGFCAGGALAGALAPAGARLVLFDPVLVSARTIVEHYADAVRRTGAEPDPVPDGDADADDLAARYAVVARKFLAGQGIPDAIVDQLCGRVAVNLRYLAMSRAAGLEGLRPDRLVVSRDHEVPAPLADVPCVRLDVSQDELLATPAAADAVVSGS